jgi:iron complex transport system ATP-binding protein
MKLQVNDAVCGYAGKKIISGISFSVSSGEILCLLGPNGVGKTTLFKSILGFLPLQGGSITADEESIGGWSRKKLAACIGYVPQSHVPPFPFTVLDVVLMGRTAHLGPFATPSKHDEKTADEALEMLDISFLRDCIYTEISGGERQMVLIARAIAQEPEILIMDEPTSNLDFGNQMRVLSRIKKLAESGLGILMTSHFPNHAFLCSSQVVLLGRNTFSAGKADDVVTEERLKEIYQIDVRIVETRLENNICIKSCVPLLSDLCTAAETKQKVRA